MTPSRLLICGISALAMFAAACGGGSGDGGGDGPRVTDPAKVATSTPLAGGVLYTIRQDGSVSASGSAASATVPAQPTLGAQATAGTASQSNSYTVVANDTCAAIAKSHNVTTDQLLAVNRTISCENLRIGDVLKIPPAATVAATARPGTTPTVRVGTTPSRTNTPAGKTYTVRSGDNCQAIADANAVTLSALLSANPSINANCTNIDVGDVLKIP